MESLIISGQQVILTKLDKLDLRRVYIDARVRFNFYSGELRGDKLIFLQNKRKESTTPLQYAKIAEVLNRVFDAPLVYIFDDLKYYERERLLNYGVYFIVTDKYVHLPFLIINTKPTQRRIAKILSPVAQYILLWHLQRNGDSRYSLRDLSEIVPYTYATVSKTIMQLSDFDLCRTEKEGRDKYIYFLEKKSLWDKAQNILVDPVLKRLYCNRVLNDENLIIGSYNALSHYSNLNPEDRQTYVIVKSDFNSLESNFEDLNDIEGNVTLEIWSYPPITNDYVDKLSLALSLRNDQDPRVEKEVKNIINSIW